MPWSQIEPIAKIRPIIQSAVEVLKTGMTKYGYAYDSNVMLIELRPSVRNRLKIWEDTDKFFADKKKKKDMPSASQSSNVSPASDVQADVKNDNDVEEEENDDDDDDNNEKDEEEDSVDDMARHVVGKSADNSTWLPSDGSQYYDCDPNSKWGLIEGAHRWQAVKVTYAALHFVCKL